MSSNSDGSIIGYIIDSKEELGFYHMYIFGVGKMKNYSASKSPIKLDGYGSKITRVILSEGITSIGDYTFEYCDHITTIDIPSTVTSIGRQAFYNCKLLENITLSENIRYIGGSAFSNTAHYNDTNNWYRNMYYIDDVLVKAKTTISGNHTLKSGTKTIVERAFENCSELTGITIPNTVVAINAWVFDDCIKLATITFEANSQCKEICGYAFYGTKITNVSIPKTVINVDIDAFCGCNSLEYIDVDQENTGYTSIDGILYNIDVTTLIKYPACSAKTEYIMPNTINKIEYNAFQAAKSITSITISANVTQISSGLFAGCTNLKIAIFENPIGWQMHYNGSFMEMTEERMNSAAVYLTHSSWWNYDWILQP